MLHNPRVTETFYFPSFAFAPLTFLIYLIALTNHRAFNFCSLSIPYVLIDRSAYANGLEFFLHCNWELHSEKDHYIIDLQQKHVDVIRLNRVFSLSGDGQYSAGDA